MTKNKLIAYWVSAQILLTAASILGMNLHVAHAVQSALFILSILLSVSFVVFFYKANMIAPMTSWRPRAALLASAVIAFTAAFMLYTLYS
jgi:hypothetical protein